MKFRSVTIILTLLAFMLAGSGVMAYKKVKVFMPQTPEIPLEGVKQIAVLDFKPGAGTSKDAGQYLADKMIQHLLTESRGIRDVQGGLLTSGVEGVTLTEGFTTKCYSVVERSRLETVLQEQAMSDDGVVDDAQAVEIGKILGVEVLIYGDVNVGSQDTKSVEKRVSFSGNNKQEYQVGCVTRKVTVSANMRIVRTETGEIIGSRRSSRTSTSKYCDGDKNAIADVGTLAGNCAAGLAWEFANVISPWYASGEFELEKIKLKEAKDEAETAAEAAEDLEIDRAYAIYKKLYDSDPYNPLFLYNMGVLYEVTGSFDKAKEMYEGAAQLKDEKSFKEATERVAGRMPLLPFYESIGVAIEPHDFEAAASDASLLAKKVTVKGGSGDRVDVFEQADKGSISAAKVPGGIQLEVLEEPGDFFLVKLLGGKQGYIPKGDVKE